MSDAAGEGDPREGRTQTGRALALVLVVVVIAVGVLRHTGPPSVAHRTAARTSPTTLPSRTVPPPTSTTTSPSPTSTTTLPLVAVADITVGVFNGLQSGSLATNLGARLRAAGYQTLAPDNTTVMTTTSTIYVVRSGYYREAARLATTLGLPAADIRRSFPATAPIPSGMAIGSDLVVVIGTSLESLASSA